MSKTFLGVDR